MMPELSAQPFILRRLEAALAPHLIPAPATARMENPKPNEPKNAYWRSGHVTALTEDVCNAEALKSARSLANIPDELRRIPWC